MGTYRKEQASKIPAMIVYTVSNEEVAESNPVQTIVFLRDNSNTKRQHDWLRKSERQANEGAGTGNHSDSST
jgi:hypothetical protein